MFALALAASTLLLVVLLGLTWLHLWRLGSTVESLQNDLSRMQTSRPASRSERTDRPAVRFALELAKGGELFPALAAVDGGYHPLATLSITNAAARSAAQTVSAEIPGWSLRAEQTVVLAPGETRSLRLQPELLPRAFENDLPQHAVLEVRAVAAGAGTLFSERRALRLHGGGEIDWGLDFANAGLSARWVTPHDATVLELVSQARRYVPRGRLAGYAENGGREAVVRHVRAQAAAIYRVLQHHGIGCAAGASNLPEAQRIRLPPETLRGSGTSCLDLSVVFASAIENLGMQPLLVVAPDHALAGVRLEQGSDEVLYLDLSLLPTREFEAAAAAGSRWLAGTPRDQVLLVDVSAARARGVYPLVERSAARAAYAAQPGPR